MCSITTKFQYCVFIGRQTVGICQKVGFVLLYIIFKDGCILLVGKVSQITLLAKPWPFSSIQLRSVAKTSSAGHQWGEPLLSSSCLSSPFRKHLTFLHFLLFELI